MVYLDYSATTPINKEVLETFNKASLNFIGNPNSLHKLGVESKKLIDSATNQIASIMGIKSEEIIYTSGSSESNNMAIKGIALKYQNRGKHIITTKLEHSSVIAPINYLQNNGFDIDFVELDSNGLVDINNLKSLMRDDTILVSINSVNSEVGILQPINEIGKLLKEYPKCFFHTDITQSVGKVNIPLDNVDLASFSAHKFYGPKGVGVLIKKEKVLLEPLIHGGKSTTIYRSGTPALPLIVSLSKALRLAITDIDNKYNYIKDLNSYLREELSKYEEVYINSNNYSIPHILNISILGIKPETMLHALEEKDIYISTQSACSSGNTSLSVMSITNDVERAKSSIRISLSSLTTMEEVKYFLSVFDDCYKHLKFKD